MIFYLLKLDEKSKKILLVLCALFILVLLCAGGIYYMIQQFMKKSGKKVDTYMYDLLKYQIIKNPKDFKKALTYYEKRNLFNETKWPIRFIFLITFIAFGLIFMFFKGNIELFFKSAFQLFPHLKWPTIKEVNASILDESLKISGPSWLPVSIFPTVIFKHPNFKDPLLYCSLVYYLCLFFSLFLISKSVLAFIARIQRGLKMSKDVFEKDLEKINLEQVAMFSQSVNSKIPVSTMKEDDS